jgi:tRNA-specific 2-thiouridylase
MSSWRRDWALLGEGRHDVTRVVVGMSGGVDSSVAAALLQEQGYDVVGIMLRLWSEPAQENEDGVELVAENKCCSLESMSDARRVAAQLGIPFYVVNVEQPFQRTIVEYFYEEYAAGRTPNPCLRCNRHIRFTLLLDRALALGADYLATGHYARVDDHPQTGLRRLRRGVDASKDQSYVLHVLSQQQLRHALFPLGELTKAEVRALAAERGLPVASKAESQELCFVAGNDYRGFMQRYAQATGRATPQGGPIYDAAGALVGQHAGLANYTIGQRKGLGVSAREPLHVLRLDAANNAVIVGPSTALDREMLTAGSVGYVAGDMPSQPFEALVKLRYKAPAVAAVVTPLPDARAEIRLRQPQRAVTPGQAVVFYDAPSGEEVVGGGLID